MGMSSAICESGGERPEGTDTETADSSLNIEMELPNGYTLNVVAGRGRYFYQDGIDADFLPLQFIGRSDISDYDHNSQEFRISSPTDGKFSWVAGVYLDKQEQEIDRLVAVDGTFGLPASLMRSFCWLDPTFLAYSPAQLAGDKLTPVPGHSRFHSYKASMMQRVALHLHRTTLNVWIFGSIPVSKALRCGNTMDAYLIGSKTLTLEQYSFKELWT